MEGSQHHKNNEKKEKKFIIFSVPFYIVQINVNITFTIHKLSSSTEEKIINLAIKVHLDDKLLKAGCTFKTLHLLRGL
ncbi:Hypothetical protein NATL1_15751 [Prochlorococcus marinus str. NATL1A]|uniref:Uncharacterized protein n=1 Tax=Prochlorococcus marinus (strain NATL1A) TaxID=167555 RepID=A2C3S2_PROM1|nr:hypothetical protein [Prochlorococcus marinus]ABM76132.1 Hypothetical protein NATL1_15751 [Prochlorococcus marinus str. NATL1A]